jgi:hypothetical protein
MGYTVNFKVSLPDGRPAEGAQIRLGGAAYSGATDRNGKCSFETTQDPYKFSIVIKKSGYRDISSAVGKNDTNLNFTLVST